MHAVTAMNARIYLTGSEHIVQMCLEVLIELGASAIRVPVQGDLMRFAKTRSLWETMMGALAAVNPGAIAYFGGVPALDTDFFHGIGVPRVHVEDSLIVLVFNGEKSPCYVDNSYGNLRRKMIAAIECAARLQPPTQVGS